LRNQYPDNGVSSEKQNRTQGEITMLPLIVIGVFWAGLALGKKFREPSDPWNSREEERHFHKDLEKWKHGGWMLYR
jgi:hypothetical protein